MTKKSNIHERAMLVNLTIRSWSGRKHDRAVTAEVAQSKHAAHDAGRYNKRLLPKQALELMQQISSAVRQEHYKRTLPWSDEGPRILSCQGFQDYQAAMLKFKRDFDKAADDFAYNYEDYVQKARSDLGELYNESDYPDPKVIRKKFAIETNILPLPDGDDLRVSLPDADVEQLRKDIEEQVKQSISNAQRDIYLRIQDVVSHMADKLTNYDPTASSRKDKGFFRNSLVDNVRDLCTLIPSLNVTDDPNLSHVLKDLEQITRCDAEDLRKDSVLRKDTAKDAQRILDQIKDYI